VASSTPIHHQRHRPWRCPQRVRTRACWASGSDGWSATRRSFP